MEFKIQFYHDDRGKSLVEEFLLDLAKTNKSLFAQTVKGLEKIKSKSYHREPLSKYIEPGIWEVRIRSGTNILRIFYTFDKGRIIILLNGFIKKSQKTPFKELEIARERMNKVKVN